MSSTAEDFESPISFEVASDSKDKQVLYIAKRMREIMTIGLGMTLDESTENTPERVARMWVNELFMGLDEDNYPDVSLFDNPNKKNPEMIFTKVDFTSICEHHLLPFRGEAYIAYIPKEYVVGLSKIPRIVNFFAARPQMQERLTRQISDSLAEKLETEDVAILIKASHDCMSCRGVEAKNSYAVTGVFLGEFLENKDLKQTFYQQTYSN
ncbi:MAG: GTP cyclohydrolase I FolE [Chlamydiales bacterium]|nr:GTP cyclohydrolase I FolE [Chlamydiia bacterium]MCP5507613.1 GTP cyclohydrolase I FolE [Chlamydiales bacterium]